VERYFRVTLEGLAGRVSISPLSPRNGTGCSPFEPGCWCPISPRVAAVGGVQSHL
jgi:hypothetical protein